MGLAGVPHAPARLVAEPYPPSVGGQSSDRGVPRHLDDAADRELGTAKRQSLLEGESFLSATRAIEPSLVDERLEESLVVLLHLRVPEHADCELLGRILERLE